MVTSKEELFGIKGSNSYDVQGRLYAQICSVKNMDHNALFTLTVDSHFRFCIYGVYLENYQRKHFQTDMKLDIQHNLYCVLYHTLQ